jgi:hypothetical protein
VIGHEEGVELARFQFLDQLLDAREIEIGIGPGARIAPRAGVDGYRPHERAELQLPLCHRPVFVAVIVGKDREAIRPAPSSQREKNFAI